MGEIWVFVAQSDDECGRSNVSFTRSKTASAATSEPEAVSSRCSVPLSGASSLTGPTGGWALSLRSWQVGPVHIDKSRCLLKLIAALRLAVAALFLGVQQPSLPLPQPWTTYLLIAYVAWLATFRLLLLLHKHFFSKQCKKASNHFSLSSC